MLAVLSLAMAHGMTLVETRDSPFHKWRTSRHVRYRDTMAYQTWARMLVGSFCSMVKMVLAWLPA